MSDRDNRWNRDDDFGDRERLTRDRNDRDRDRNRFAEDDWTRPSDYGRDAYRGGGFMGGSYDRNAGDDSRDDYSNRPENRGGYLGGGYGRSDRDRMSSYDEDRTSNYYDRDKTSNYERNDSDMKNRGEFSGSPDSGLSHNSGGIGFGDYSERGWERNPRHTAPSSRPRGYGDFTAAQSYGARAAAERGTNDWHRDTAQRTTSASLGDFTRSTTDTPDRSTASFGFGETNQPNFRGRGPRGYQRSDERIHEMVCDRLADHDMIDASDIEVTVQGGEVTLAGSVDQRRTKRLAEDVIENVPGVRDVHNNLKVDQSFFSRVKEALKDAAGTATTGSTEIESTRTDETRKF